MHTGKLLQTVALLLLVAMAASCAVTKDYSARIFPSRIDRPAMIRDSQSMVLRFLDMDTADSEKAYWVSTDIIMRRDSSSGSATLDNFSKTFPANKKDSVSAEGNGEAEKKSEPVVMSEAKPIVIKEAPVAKTYDRSPVRTKRTRETP